MPHETLQQSPDQHVDRISELLGKVNSSFPGLWEDKWKPAFVPDLAFISYILATNFQINLEKKISPLILNLIKTPSDFRPGRKSVAIIAACI